MKKQFFFGALACLALASCSNDKTLDVNRIENEIRYNVVANGATKASDVYCNNNKPGAFEVWANFAGQTYISGDTIKFEADKWVNKDGVRYWPETTETNKVDFYAHVNSNGTFEWNSGAPEFVNYVVDTDVTKQDDLLYSVKKDQSKGNAAVALNFHHALSQIVFNAKNTNKNLHVEITGVELRNVMSTGTYTFATESTDGNNAAHDGNGTINGGQGSWSALSAINNYGVTFSSVAVAGDDTTVALTSANDSEKEFSSNALLLIPQATTAWNGVDATEGEGATTNSYILVYCKVYNVAGDSYASSDVLLYDGSTKGLAIPAAFNWEEGKKYTYTLVFGKGAGYEPGTDPEPTLVPIEFDVTVDDFVAVEPSTEVDAAIPGV